MLQKADQFEKWGKYDQGKRNFFGAVGDFFGAVGFGIPGSFWQAGREAVSIPDQVSARGREIRAESYTKIANGDFVTAPSEYGAGAMFELGGSVFSFLLHGPGHLYDAGHYEWRYYGWSGEKEQKKARLENALFKTEAYLLWKNKAGIASTLWNNAGEIFHSAISAQPPCITLSGNLENALYEAKFRIGGTEVPVLDLAGLYFAGSSRTEIIAGAISGVTGEATSIGTKRLLGWGVGLPIFYGEIREGNSRLLDHYLFAHPNVNFELSDDKLTLEFSGGK
jgi:hypothetical protein